MAQVSPLLELVTPFLCRFVASIPRWRFSVSGRSLHVRRFSENARLFCGWFIERVLLSVCRKVWKRWALNRCILSWFDISRCGTEEATINLMADLIGFRNWILYRCIGNIYRHSSKVLGHLFLIELLYWHINYKLHSCFNRIVNISSVYLSRKCCFSMFLSRTLFLPIFKLKITERIRMIKEERMKKEKAKIVGNRERIN